MGAMDAANTTDATDVTKATKTTDATDVTKATDIADATNISENQTPKHITCIGRAYTAYKRA